MTESDTKRDTRHDSSRARASRRRFLTDTVRTICSMGLVAAGLGLYARQSRSLPATAIRPPGALEEDRFQSACIRCGLCARDCPFDILHLAELGANVATGTPYFIARDIPCEMCEDIPCVKACPTGALDHALTNIDDSRMGLAALVDEENCLNFLGLRCDVCYRVCPVIDKAISLEPQHNPRTGRHTLFIPVVHSDACTGCGKCEYACVLPEAAIKVLPTHLAKGAAAEHYRLGWEEKQRAGESLVAPDTEHRYTLPEGYEYEHEGRGLKIPESKPPAGKPPFADNPLDTLNRPRERR